MAHVWCLRQALTPFVTSENPFVSLHVGCATALRLKTSEGQGQPLCVCVTPCRADGFGRDMWKYPDTVSVVLPSL